jgi:hypothetical protein
MGWPAAAIAHTVKVAEDAAATLHIEPNDTPKAGETSQVWFALTRQGGQLIPLEDCACALKIYPQPSQAETAPLLTPPLKPINTGQYQGIPGTTVVFPKAGRYLLKLSGHPKNDDVFKPFVLRYEVTVAGGTANANTPEIASSSQIARSPVRPGVEETIQPPPIFQTVLLASAAILGIGGVLFAIQRFQQK